MVSRIDDKTHCIEVIFNDESDMFTEEPEFNLSYLKSKEKYCNDVLKSKEDHTVYLCQVLTELGLPIDTFVRKVGWHDDGSGDIYIDFGLFDKRNEKFIKGLTPIAHLYFNTNMINPDR